MFALISAAYAVHRSVNELEFDPITALAVFMRLHCTSWLRMRSISFSSNE